MKIRKATKKDFKNFADLTNKLHSYITKIDYQGLEKESPKYREIAARYYFDQVDNNEGIIVFAENRNRIIGCGVAIVIEPDELTKVKYKEKYQKTGLIKDIFVEESYRKHGIGTKLIKKLENHLKNRGCKIIRLEVFTPNTAALKTYKDIGYQDRLLTMIKKL